MGDLQLDTDVTPTGRPGELVATLKDDWAIWGPNGGYVATVLLRAMAAESPHQRPASFTCHYLGVAAFDEVQLRVATTRASKRATALRVSMTQGDQPIAEAVAWFVADLAALEHDAAPPPDAPPPLTVPTIEERLPEEERPFPFWRNIENRPLLWRDDWLEREPSEPRLVNWFRFQPRATFADPVVDAGRLVVLLDTMQWPSATPAYRESELTYIAPSLDLSVVFHRFAPAEEFLLVEARSPAAAHGLVGGTAAVWGGGRLLASANQQMLCRPVPAPG